MKYNLTEEEAISLLYSNGLWYKYKQMAITLYDIYKIFKTGKYPNN